MDLGLQGKTALVLAGSKGLGKAVAMALAAEGVHVAISGRTEATLTQTAAEIQQLGGSTFPLIWDVGDLDQLDSKVAEVEKHFGPIDILFNNTGGPPPTPAAGQSIDVWSNNFRSMVLSVIAVTDRVLPGMRARQWGRIITSTSSGVESPIPNLAISNTLRISLVGWSKTLSQEVAKEGITANILIPGRIATDRLRSLDEARSKRESRSLQDIEKDNLAVIPMGRYGDPFEYGSAAAFLASECASYITGSIIRVDGGLIAGI